MQTQFNRTLASSQPRLQAADGHKMPNREKRAPIDTGAHELTRRGDESGSHYPAGSGRGDRITGELGLSIHPSARDSTPRKYYFTNRASRPLNPSADRPATMPAPETENQKKVLWPTSMSEPTSLGGLGP